MGKGTGNQKRVPVMLNEVKHRSGQVAGRSFTSFRMTIGQGMGGNECGSCAAPIFGALPVTLHTEDKPTNRLQDTVRDRHFDTCRLPMGL